MEQALILEEKMALQLRLLAAAGVPTLMDQPDYCQLMSDEADTSQMCKEVLSAVHVSTNSWVCSPHTVELFWQCPFIQMAQPTCWAAACCLLQFGMAHLLGRMTRCFIFAIYNILLSLVTCTMLMLLEKCSYYFNNTLLLPYQRSTFHC